MKVLTFWVFWLSIAAFVLGLIVASLNNLSWPYPAEARSYLIEVSTDEQ